MLILLIIQSASCLKILAVFPIYNLRGGGLGNSSTKIAVISKDDDLLNALVCYQRTFKMSYDFVKFEKTIPPSEIDIIITHNVVPEMLDGLRFLVALRSNQDYSSIPVIFISENLSEHGRILYQDVELVSQQLLPFNSFNFFEACKSKVSWIQKEKDLLYCRKEVDRAIAVKDKSKAKESFDRLKTIYDDAFALTILEARVCELNEDYDAAVRASRKALELHPDSLIAHNRLASIYMLKGERAKAVDTVNKSLKLSEIQLKNLLHWGDVYMERGEADKAAFSYETALKTDSELKEAKHGKLAADILSGKVSMVNEILKDSPMANELAKICNLKGISMVHNKSHESADKLYLNAMKFLQDDDERYKLWLNMGLAMKKGGEYEKAIEYFNSGRKVQPAGYNRFDEQIEHVKKLIEN